MSMITSSLKGEDLYNDLKKDIELVKKRIRKERDKMRKPYLSKRRATKIEDWIYSSTVFTSPLTQNKWFIKTGMKGNPEKAEADNHIHCKGISNDGSTFYVIFRGLKPRPDGQKAHYIINIGGHVIKRIRERLNVSSDISNEELVSQVFDRTETSVYFPWDWIQSKKEEEESGSRQLEEKIEAGYVPTADEIWSMYEKEQKEPRKPWYTEDEYYGQMILRTAMGYFCGVVRGGKEILCKTFLTYETANESERDLFDGMLDPAYVYYNKDKFSSDIYDAMMKTWKKTIDGLDRDDVRIYQLYP